MLLTASLFGEEWISKVLADYKILRFTEFNQKKKTICVKIKHNTVE